MTDIVERLRARAGDGGRPSLWPGMMREAADEIERLRALLAETRQYLMGGPWRYSESPDETIRRALEEKP